MRLECTDGALGRVAAVDVRWDKLVIAVPVFLDDALVLGAGFVAEYLERDHMVSRMETAHD